MSVDGVMTFRFLFLGQQVSNTADMVTKGTEGTETKGTEGTEGTETKDTAATIKDTAAVTAVDLTKDINCFILYLSIVLSLF